MKIRETIMNAVEKKRKNRGLGKEGKYLAGNSKVRF